jgi:hypothetical protein
LLVKELGKIIGLLTLQKALLSEEDEEAASGADD